jgi:hypothetical protein
MANVLTGQDLQFEPQSALFRSINEKGGGGTALAIIGGTVHGLISPLKAVYSGDAYAIGSSLTELTFGAGTGKVLGTAGRAAPSKLEPQIVYRAITPAEAAALSQGRGLTAKAPNGTWTAAEHVSNAGPGAGGAAKNSPWISTSRNIEVAKAYDSGSGVIAIDLNKVSSLQVEVWRTAPRTNGVEGLPYHRSIWAEEVTIHHSIPLDAVLGRFK